jgi:hypothetical protein
VVQWYSISFLIQRLKVRPHTCALKAFAQYFFNIPWKFLNSFQVVLGKNIYEQFLPIWGNHFCISKLLGNCSWVLGQCTIFKTENPEFYIASSHVFVALKWPIKKKKNDDANLSWWRNYHTKPLISHTFSGDCPFKTRIVHNQSANHQGLSIHT